MKSYRNSQISESEEEEVELNFAQASTSKGISENNNDSSSESSAESEKNVRLSPTPSPTKKSPKKNILSNLEKFVQENDLKKLDVKEVIGKHDDVCLLEVPKNIDATHFIGKLVNFDRRTKIKLNKVKYVIEPELGDLKPINLLTNDLKKIHLVSSLKLREYNKHKHKTNLTETEGEFKVPNFQQNLKVRHPLFGSEYKPKIVLSEEIQQKLDEVIEKTMTKTKKKKHKKKDENKDFTSIEEPRYFEKKKKKQKIKTEHESSEMDERDDNERGGVDESIFSLLEDMTKKEKNKKSHKNNGREDPSISFLNFNSFSGQGEDSSEPVEFKKKGKNSVKIERTSEPDEENSMENRKKKIRVKTDLSSTELNIENNDTKKKKHSISKDEVKLKQRESSLDTTQSDFFSADELNTTERRKKKKKKHKNADRDEEYENIKQRESENLNESTSKKKKDANISSKEDDIQVERKNFEKKKRNSFINSTVIPDLHLPLFEFDVSGIANREEEEMNNESENVQNTLVKEEGAHKKKKKNKSLGEEEEMNNESENVQNTLVKEEGAHKKKKKNKSLGEEEDLEERKGKKKIKVEYQTADESYSDFEGSSKKRKRKHSVNNEEELSSSKKKKKKIKEEPAETESLISDILNKIKSEINTSTVHKKKKKSNR